MSELVTDDDIFSQQVTGPGRPKKQSHASQQKHTETLSAAAWQSTIVSDGTIQIKVTRVAPTHWPIGSRNEIKGYCTTYHEPIDEARIQSEFGGGTYLLQAVGSDGKPLVAPIYVPISGDPIVTTAQLKKEDDATSKSMYSFIEKTANSRIEDIRNASATTVSVVENTTKFLERQLESEKQDKLRLEARIVALQTQVQEALQPRANPQQDKLVEMIASNTMNQANMSTQRYESELRQTKELAAANDQRLQNAFDRDRAMLLDNAQRELNFVRATLEQNAAMTKASLEREIDNLKSHFEHRSLAEKTTLSTELMLLKSKLEDTQAMLLAKEAELVSLRAKKDQTLQEKVAEVETFREFFAGSKDEGEPATGLTGVLGKMMESPLVKNIAGKVLASAMEQPAAAPLPTAQPAPSPLPARLPPPQIRRPVRPPAAAGTAPLIPMVAPVAEVVPPAPPAVPVTSGEVDAALVYCKAAFDAQQDPAAFATSVKDLIPANVLNEIRNKGADEFLKAHGKSDVFATQQGKNWIRKVTQTLNR